MRNISDALELLTAQHEEIDGLLLHVHETLDPSAFDDLADKLASHLATEQQLFYPVIEAAMSRDVYDELLREHVAIKRVLAEMLWLGVDDAAAFAGKLVELSQLMIGHAGWQEEELFKCVAQVVPAERLASLGRQMREHGDAFPLLAAA